MTVSQLFIDCAVVDATVNWGTYMELTKREQERAKENNEAVKEVSAPKYDKNDYSFQHFMKTLALSTTAFFSFNPGNDLLRARYAKIHKINVDNVPMEPEIPEMIAEFKKIKEELIEAEKLKPVFK